MQFSEQWLRTFVDPQLDSADLGHLLTMAGLEVEEAEPAAPAFSGVVVAQIVEAERHPNADKLKLVAVNGGNGPVLPSEETVKSKQYTPLGRPLFIYVSRAAAARPEVATFIRYYLETAAALASLAYLTVVGSVVAFLAYYWLIRHIEVTRVLLIPLITPLVAVGIATFVGLTWWSLGAVVALSLVIGVVLRLGSGLLEVPISAMLVLVRQE